MVARTATTTANASAIFVTMVVLAASLVSAIFCSPMRHRPQAAASTLRWQLLRADGDPRLPDICCAKVYVACPVCRGRSVNGSQVSPTRDGEGVSCDGRQSVVAAGLAGVSPVARQEKKGVMRKLLLLSRFSAAVWPSRDDTSGRMVAQSCACGHQSWEWAFSSYDDADRPALALAEQLGGCNPGIA